MVFGRALKPVTCGHGLVIGAGEVVPEINFTLPPMNCNEATWPKVQEQYREMIAGVIKRAVELEAPSLLVEFETVPDMTLRPEWGLAICRILADALRKAHGKHGLKGALRFTPNDTREFSRPPRMRSGPHWEAMQRMFDEAGASGADLISIESTGGKEVCDDALIQADVERAVFALGVLGARDMSFLWKRIVEACRRDGRVIPAGDSACGFANTAMVLANQGMIPRVFASVIRVAAVPRTLVAMEEGAVGPSKDCAYEGPYLKAIAGVPISMEGRSAACAHLSPIGNIAQAVCDVWSNESVQNVQLLSGRAPIVSTEQLVYDCRLMNIALSKSEEDAGHLRDWLVESDARLDPQAWVLRPDVVMELSEKIMEEKTAYARTRRAVMETLGELQRAFSAGDLRIPEREEKWLSMLSTMAEELPEEESELIERMRPQIDPEKCRLEEYGL